MRRGRMQQQPVAAHTSLFLCAQVSLLKARHDHLEAKAAAERELYDRAIAALDQQNAALRDTRAALQVRANARGCGGACSLPPRVPPLPPLVPFFSRRPRPTWICCGAVRPPRRRSKRSCARRARRRGGSRCATCPAPFLPLGPHTYPLTLQASLSDLAASPFIAEGRDAAVRRERLETLERSDKALRDQVR